MSTFGTGTFGSGTFANPGPTTITLTDGINDAIGQDAPTATFGAEVGGGDVAETIALDAPGITTDVTVTATDGTADDIAMDAPTVTFSASPDRDAIFTDGIGDDIATDPPTASTEVPVDDGIADDITPGDGPALDFTATPAAPDGINEPIGIGDPTAAFDATTDAGDDLAIDLTIGDGPTVDTAPLALDDGIADTISTDAPTAAFASTPIDAAGDLTIDVTIGDDPAVGTAPLLLDDGINDAIGMDAPSVGVFLAATGIGDLAVTAASDAPTATFAQAVTALGNLPIPISNDDPATAFTQQITITAGIAVPITNDAPGGTGTSALPPGIGETIALDAPTVAWQATASNIGGIAEGINQGALTMGILITMTGGIAVAVSMDTPAVAWRGTITPDPIYDPINLGPITVRKPAQPWATPPVLPTPATFERRDLPIHLLGIGPTDAGVPWRGAPNAGVKGGRISRPRLPAIALPQATAKTFTLRLNAGSEASSTHAFERSQSIVIDEMLTDLWWRRKDPHTTAVEAIGRFNADKVDIQATGTGLNLSVNWADYRALLEARLVLKYKDTVNSESLWAKGTLVTDILRFAIPTNTNIDLTNIEAATAYDLGHISQPFELPPGTTIKETLDNVNAISYAHWEWWIEMPTADGSPPKLMFTLGERGRFNTGITLVDDDGIHGPIESWTLQAASESYANAIFYSGSTGGSVIVLDEDIKTYGQRDAIGSDSSLKGNIVLIDAAGRKQLAELAARIPSYTVVLRQGFWEGRSHIDVGDYISLNITLGDEAIAGKYRVQEIQGEIDDSGMETITLTLGSPRPAKDPRSRLSATARIVRRLKNYERKGT